LHRIGVYDYQRHHRENREKQINTIGDYVDVAEKKMAASRF